MFYDLRANMQQLRIYFSVVAEAKLLPFNFLRTFSHSSQFLILISQKFYLNGELKNRKTLLLLLLPTSLHSFTYNVFNVSFVLGTQTE